MVRGMFLSSTSSVGRKVTMAVHVADSENITTPTSQPCGYFPESSSGRTPSIIEGLFELLGRREALAGHDDPHDHLAQSEMLPE